MQGIKNDSYSKNFVTSFALAVCMLFMWGFNISMLWNNFRWYWLCAMPVTSFLFLFTLVAIFVSVNKMKAEEQKSVKSSETDNSATTTDEYYT